VPPIEKTKMSKSGKKGNSIKMFNPYLYEMLTQAHSQELLHEAEQQRMLAQLPRRHPQLMRTIAQRFAAFLMSFSFITKKMEHSRKMVTGEL
jgi:hypothetical protein